MHAAMGQVKKDKYVSKRCEHGNSRIIVREPAVNRESSFTMDYKKSVVLIDVIIPMGTKSDIYNEATTLQHIRI